MDKTAFNCDSLSANDYRYNCFSLKHQEMIAHHYHISSLNSASELTVNCSFKAFFKNWNSIVDSPSREQNLQTKISVFITKNLHIFIRRANIKGIDSFALKRSIPLKASQISHSLQIELKLSAFCMVLTMQNAIGI